MLPAGYDISTDQARLDLDTIYEFLSSESYWAVGRPRQAVERSIAHSLCFGAFFGDAQVGFARVVTDHAYLWDVFVIREHRGHGLGKALIKAVVEHPDLQGFRWVLLATADAHGLYEQFGFEPLLHPERFLAIYRPGRP